MTLLVRTLCTLDHLGGELTPSELVELRSMSEDLRPMLGLKLPHSGYLACLSPSSASTQSGVSGPRPLVYWAGRTDLQRKAAHLVGMDQRSELAPAEVAWKDFERRAAEYYGLLGEIVELGGDNEAAQGFLPEEVARQIEAQKLDTTWLRVGLRGYQAFGAKFVLVQRRTILGDEMGLGKTIQAMAAMAHLRARDSARHFLVVCPSSVIVNWIRELESKSTLSAHRLQGPGRAVDLRRWAHRGGVAVTTFGTLPSLYLPADLRLGMLTIDEAHFVKNPAAKRSVATARAITQADRVVFLTGTPIENRLSEFQNLVAYLQPRLARQLDSASAVAGARAFRRQVAPVYLRRNQEDVLLELPGLIEVEEWEDFGRHDGDAYLRAVRDGNFMAMRRAAFHSADPAESTKLRRLVEIVEEATDNGLKVVVFSYFRDVLDVVRRVLGPLGIGPITGSVTADLRQQIIDEFTNLPQPRVLVSQVIAGGVGTNLQAASVVVLCEPQVKPSLEDQAIARAHRMGQVRPVQVHRLLVEDSVDQRMLEILGTKRALIQDYVGESTLAQASPEALDISEAELARIVVQAEQERLAEELRRQFESERQG